MQFREMLRDEHEEGVQEGLKEGVKKGLKQRDQMLIFKWSADGRELSEIASLLSITEEEVRKVLAEEDARGQTSMCSTQRWTTSEG